MKGLAMNTSEQHGVAGGNPMIASLALTTALPMTAAQYAAKLIGQRWGDESLRALMVDLNYDFYGYRADGNVHLGKVRTSQNLVQALLNNYQTVGAGRFGETAFGLYTQPRVGPQVRIVAIEEAINPGSGFRDYEGIYRQTRPQVYGPDTQLALQPAEFKQWVWELEFQSQYAAYVGDAWPADETLLAAAAYPLRTGVKAAFVMAAWLQRQENSLTVPAHGLALRAAGLEPQQPWTQLTVEHMQVRAPIPPSVEAARLMIYRYTSSDIWSFRDKASGRIVLYVPGNSSAFHEFADHQALLDWVVDIARHPVRRQALAAHFAEDDREDGTFHAGVLSALEGIAIYPRQYQLKKGSGFFNNDGYWPAGDYIQLQVPPPLTDPFAQWVRVMKQAALASIDSIRDDAQVNRDNLSAVVEPVAQWIEKFGPLALFVPGGEGLLALAGLIDAGYGVAQAVEGQTADERSAGITRTVFGLLNALPVAMAGALVKTEERAVAATDPQPQPQPPQGVLEAPVPALATDVPSSSLVLSERLRLLRGLGPEVASFSDEVLGQIGHVCDINNDLLTLMQAGRRPQAPILVDTIARFRLDQDIQQALGQAVSPSPAELFRLRYGALQQSDHEWVKLFQHHYPDLPRGAIEQMLDRAGVDIDAPHTLADAKRMLSELSAKGQQYQFHVRLTRAYEGLYLRSVECADSDVLALHSLRRLPGWSPQTRIEIIDGTSANARVLDSIGPGSGGHYRQLIRQGSGYQATPPVIGRTVDFHTALLDALPAEQRTALGLRPESALQDLQVKLRESALPRAELETGLQRMDAGMPFDRQGLRGGGYPDTPQSAALTMEILGVQLRQIYPGITPQEVEEFAQRWGPSVQNRLSILSDQLQQLRIDLEEWVEQVEQDAEDMDVDWLDSDDEDAQGMDPGELDVANEARLDDAMELERRSRVELANDLEARWQRQGDAASHVYEGGQFTGFRLEMDFENLHSLPRLNAKLPDVVELSATHLTLTQIDSLSGFLKCFPNLRTLDLAQTDLRSTVQGGGFGASLPEAISQLTQLTRLNLRATWLTLTEQAAGRLGELTRLEELDLSENPLGTAPVVVQMLALRRLNLRSTGIQICPVGIRDHAYLQRLDLRDNQIGLIPEPVRVQSVAPYNLLLAGNPLSDTDSLRWVMTHRQQTGINVWLGPPHPEIVSAQPWLAGLAPQDAVLQVARWERLVAKEGSDRFFGTLDLARRTADFQVDYVPLQQRVWNMLTAIDASPALCQHLFQEVQWTALDGDNPFASLSRLEDRIAAFQAAGAAP